MSEEIQVRKLSKKSIIIIGILILLALATFFLSQNGKSVKATKILHNLDYKNVSNVKVYSVTKVEDKDTKIQGFKYFVVFTNETTNQECKGYLLKDFKRKYKQDLNCKDK